MSVEVKDQDMSEFETWIRNKEFDKAYEWLDKSQSGHNKEFNTALVKYYQGDLAKAREILEGLKLKGFASKELTEAIHTVKQDLNLVMLEREYDREDVFILTSSSLPELFYPTISVIILFTSLVYGIKRRFIITSVFFILSLLPLFIYQRVNSFQVEINREETTIYRGPSKIFEEVEILPLGVQFIVTKSSKDWRYIEYPSLFRGWIRQGKEFNE